MVRNLIRAGRAAQPPYVTLVVVVLLSVSVCVCFFLLLLFVCLLQFKRLNSIHHR